MLGNTLSCLVVTMLWALRKGKMSMCISHSVHRSGDKSKDRLDAVVFKDKSVSDKAIAALKAADPATDTFLDVTFLDGLSLEVLPRLS